MFKKLGEFVKERRKKVIRPPKGYRIIFKDCVVSAVNDKEEKIWWIPEGSDKNGQEVEGFWYHLDGTNHLTEAQRYRFQQWFFEN